MCFVYFSMRELIMGNFLLSNTLLTTPNEKCNVMSKNQLYIYINVIICYQIAFKYQNLMFKVQHVLVWHLYTILALTAALFF